MDRVAVFVDAGYLFAQGSLLLAGKRLRRSEVALQPEEAVHGLGAFASKVSGVPLLRVYWYDGTSTGPTAQHLTLAQDVTGIRQQAEPAPVPADPLGGLAGKIAGQLEQAEVAALVEAFEATHQLPRDLDRQLLAGGRSAIRRDLASLEKQQIRQQFIQACRLRLAQ